MIDVCPAITESLNWLPWLLLAAVLADVVLVLGGALIVRKRIAD